MEATPASAPSAQKRCPALQRRAPHAQAALAAKKAGLPKPTVQRNSLSTGCHTSLTSRMAQPGQRPLPCGRLGCSRPAHSARAASPLISARARPEAGSPERRASPPCPPLPASRRTALAESLLSPDSSADSGFGLGSCSETRVPGIGLVFLQWEQMPEMTPYNGPGTVPVRS